MRRGPGTCPPPSGKSSVSSSTTWKPLSTSFLPLLPSVCSSAGLQETTVVVNCTERDREKARPQPSGHWDGVSLGTPSARRSPPAPPHPPSPSRPHLAGVAVPLTPERHRRRLPGRGDPRTLERPLADGEPRGTIFTAGASPRRSKGWGVAWTNFLQMRFAICDLQTFRGA